MAGTTNTVTTIYNTTPFESFKDQ